MTNEQTEEVIKYLNENKNNLPTYMSELLEPLFDNLKYEKILLNNFNLDSVLNKDTFPDFFLQNYIKKDEQISLLSSNKENDYSNFADPNFSIDLSFLVNEQHPKDNGSNYPTNTPLLLSQEELQKKIIDFPKIQITEEQHLADIKSLNSTIKSYKDNLKKKENELFKKNQIDDNNSFQWIEISELEKLKEELSTSGTPDKVAKFKKYLDKCQTHKPVLQFKEFEQFNSLTKDCPNFKEVSKFYKGSFVLNNSKYLFDKSYTAPTPILLLGEPGIGKTHFAKKLAKLLGTSFHFLDSNSITASWVLTGSSGQWQNSDAGNIFKYILDSNTISPVVILDEIDKLSQGKNYDPFSVFHQMFEPENSAQFKDEFLNVSFDASKIIYILTANNSNNIPESLLSRMRVFDIQKPNEEEMKVITQNIYKEIIGHTPMLKSNLLDHALDKLVSLAPRDIKKEISNAVFSQLAENQDFDQELILDFKKYQKNWGF